MQKNLRRKKKKNEAKFCEKQIYVMKRKERKKEKKWIFVPLFLWSCFVEKREREREKTCSSHQKTITGGLESDSSSFSQERMEKMDFSLFETHTNTHEKKLCFLYFLLHFLEAVLQLLLLSPNNKKTLQTTTRTKTTHIEIITSALCSVRKNRSIERRNEKCIFQEN